MSRLLPRYNPPADNWPQKLERILLETGEPAPETSSNTKTFTDHTDNARLRGIPAIGRGVAGAIPGTAPHRIRSEP